jgi:hypothetical protein
MVCVRVPLLLKQNVGVLFGVLRGPHSDIPLFLACYDSVSLLYLAVSFLLCYEAEL